MWAPSFALKAFEKIATRFAFILAREEIRSLKTVEHPHGPGETWSEPSDV